MYDYKKNKFCMYDIFVTDFQTLFHEYIYILGKSALM